MDVIWAAAIVTVSAALYASVAAVANAWTKRAEIAARLERFGDDADADKRLTMLEDRVRELNNTVAQLKTRAALK